MNNPDKPEPSEIARLTEEVVKLNAHRFVWLQNRPWRMVWHQFLRGLAFGLGTTLGATVLLSLLVWWLSQFEFIPILGEWAAELAKEIEQIR